MVNSIETPDRIQVSRTKARRRGFGIYAGAAVVAPLVFITGCGTHTSSPAPSSAPTTSESSAPYTSYCAGGSDVGINLILEKTPASPSGLGIIEYRPLLSDKISTTSVEIQVVHDVKANTDTFHLSTPAGGPESANFSKNLLVSMVIVDFGDASLPPSMGDIATALEDPSTSLGQDARSCPPIQIS